MRIDLFELRPQRFYPEASGLLGLTKSVILLCGCLIVGCFQHKQKICSFIKNCSMSNKDLKQEINNVLDSIPEDILEDVLNYLRVISNKSKSTIQMSQNLSKILDEDKNLLERLAQ